MQAPELPAPRLALVPSDASPEAHLARMLALRDALAALLNAQRAAAGLEALPVTHDHIVQLVQLTSAVVEDLPPIFEWGFGSARIYIERKSGRLDVRMSAGKMRRL